MPIFTAPGVYTTIQDLSQYAAPVSVTVCGIVGAARKGPILGQYNSSTKSFNTPTLVTSPEKFVATFGIPSPDMQGPYAALLYLQQGRQLYYGRVAGSGAAKSTKVFDTKLTVDAFSEGVWGDKVSITIEDSDVADRKKLTVYEDIEGTPVSREQYDNLSDDSDDPNFYDDAINGVSELVQVTYNTAVTGQPANSSLDSFGNPIPEYLQNGNDGAPPDDAEVVGGEFSGYATGLYAFADTETIDVSILAAPGYASANVVAAIQTICERRQDCLGLVHGPFGLNAQEIIDWHNAAGAFISTSVQLTSNTCALYWPWIEIFDPYNSRNMWVPPVGFASQKLAFTDNTGEPWFAPAGINRGKLFEALRVEYNATLGDREAMYGPGNGNAVNPIVNLPMDGINIYGQRTLQRTASSLDRINVRRLIFFMSKVLSRTARVLVFEQNDRQLWDQFIQIVEPFVSDIKSRRGVEEFKVVCDETTNTPYKRNNNEMHGYVLIIPTKSAEKIVVNFGLFPSGASLSVPKIG